MNELMSDRIGKPQCKGLSLIQETGADYNLSEEGGETS